MRRMKVNMKTLLTSLLMTLHSLFSLEREQGFLNTKKDHDSIGKKRRSRKRMKRKKERERRENNVKEKVKRTGTEI